MSVTASRILNAIIELSEIQSLKVTVAESFKGALLTGTCAFAGGLLGGPVGLGIGGVVGACVASVRGQGKYKPLAQVIMNDMTEEQWERLTSNIQRVVQNVHKEDLLMLLPLLMQNSSLQTLVLNEVRSFLSREMQMRLL